MCAMEDVLTVYERPYDPKNPVVCLDESPKQLVKAIRAPYIDSKGDKYEDYEYERAGSADIFMITEPLGGRREVFVEQNHNGDTWAKTIAYIVEQMHPEADKVTIVEDNLSAHRKYNLYNVFEASRARAIIDKIEFVFTPKHGSWLNIAECELSVLSRQALDRRFATSEELEEAVKIWAKDRNFKQKGVNWQFTNKDARIKLKRLYPIIVN